MRRVILPIAATILLATACSGGGSGEVVTPPIEAPTSEVEVATPTPPPASTPTPQPEPTATPSPPPDPTPTATETPSPEPVSTAIEEGFLPVPELPVPDDIAEQFAPPNLPPLLVDGPYTWPERGMDQITDPMLREAVWAIVSQANANLALLNFGPDNADWLKAHEVMTDPNITASLEQSGQEHAEGWRIETTDRERFAAVRIFGLDEAELGFLSIRICHHFDRTLVNQTTDEVRLFAGSRTATFLMDEIDGRWRRVGSGTAWVEDEQFVECPDI